MIRLRVEDLESIRQQPTGPEHTHGGAALRALHSVVAHARLDVAEDPAAG